MKTALVPLNPLVGAVEHNLGKILDFIDQAVTLQCHLIVFPEMSLIGYPPKDYLYYENLFKQQSKALNQIKRKSRKITIIVGGYALNTKRGRPFKNVAYIFQNGQSHIYDKQLLPNYDVFDECRYFEPGTKPLRIKIAGKWVGLTVCEDIWFSEKKLEKRYHNDPILRYRSMKLDYLINISASPFEFNKQQRRENLLKFVAKKSNATLIYLNQSGANDDLIFDGGTYVLNKQGQLLFSNADFSETLQVYDDQEKRSTPAESPADIENLRQALIVGIRDYVHKTGFEDVVIGLSGGVDSALVTVLACEALGASHVLCVLMPSRYSSEGSIQDSLQLVQKLGCSHKLISIENLHQAFESLFSSVFKNQIHDLTSQNIQARIRGNILMAISNNERCLLLNTTNKSEMAMGYGTLYGDMCGALAVISDLTKTQIYQLCRHINNKPNPVIPDAILTKAPSAELKPNQKDSDSLPPYDLLDKLVVDFVDHHAVQDHLKSIGQDSKRALRQILINEYKRKQAPIGLKVSEKSFGTGRRFPIVGRLEL